MSVIIVNNFCDSIIEITLFDNKSQYPPYDLNTFSAFIFQVFEPGIKDPILEICNNDISVSNEDRRYNPNKVNIKISKNQLSPFIPNPHISDRVREYRLFGKDKDGMNQLLEQDCFYIEDSLMGR